MKAIIYTEYGPPDVLQLKEVEKPAPGGNEVLVKVQAASVNKLDLLMRGPFLARIITGGLLKPKITSLGADLSGLVEAVGSNVRQFRPGDEVFGRGIGTFAEYACAAENKLARKPANISFEEAAAVPVAALTALQCLRDHGKIQPGQKVLIYGASGGVGTFAVQIAKSFGAEVTAVCSTQNSVKARSLGADHVIDYTKENFGQNGTKYDLIVAVNGYKPIQEYKRALNPSGIYVVLGGTLAQIFQGFFLGPLISRNGKQKMGFMGITKVNQRDLIFLKDLLESGKLLSFIEKCYPLSETAEAVRYLENGHAQGKVVITVKHTNKT